MKREEHFLEIISILEGVLSGALDAKSAMKNWPDIDRETNQTVKAIWHDLSHYANDRDVHIRDNSYEEYQKGLLKAGIAKLRKMSCP